MFLHTDLNKELQDCPITQFDTIQDIEIIRDFYFTIIDKYNFGYKALNMCLCYTKNTEIIINCDRNTLFNIKFITKLNEMDNLCLSYNKYCYYNIFEFDQFKKDYKNFFDNNDTSFLENWYEGNDLDANKLNKHITNKNIKWASDVAPYM